MLTHSSLKLDASLEAGKISEDKFHIKRFASSEELTNDESVEVLIIRLIIIHTCSFVVYQINPLRTTRWLDKQQ